MEPVEGAADTCARQSARRRRGVADLAPSLWLPGEKREQPEENVNGRNLVPGLSADVTRRTLFGRAVTIGAALQYERDEPRRLFLNTPTLFGRPVQSSFTLERSREESRVNALITDITSTAWEQRGRLRPAQPLVRPALRAQSNVRYDADGPRLPFQSHRPHRAAHVSSLTWDSRDNPSDSTSGTFVSTSFEHGSSGLGSDLLFVGIADAGLYFRPWKSLVFASAARYGAVKPLEEQLLVSSLRFFAGGARTVRGVPEDSLGGLDFLGDPLGGRGLLTLKSGNPVSSSIAGCAAWGSWTWATSSPRYRAYRLRELVGSTGFGLRLVTRVRLVPGGLRQDNLESARGRRRAAGRSGSGRRSKGS